DGERELPVDHPGAAGLQGARNEHRRQHRGDGDDRAGDLLHRLAGRFLRRQLLLAHDALDRLDDHDGIVHHDADREHHRKERQLTPAGKLGAMLFILASTAFATSSALALGASWMPNAATGVAPMRVSKPYCAAPRVTRATSRSRTEAPFGSVRSRMFSNCSGV